MLAGLQGPQIGHDRPAILGRHLPRVRRHGAITFADDGEQAADRRLAQPRNVVRRRPRIAPLDDFAKPRAERIVANDAVNLIAVAAMADERFIDGKRKLLDEIAVFVETPRAVAASFGRWLLLFF